MALEIQKIYNMGRSDYTRRTAIGRSTRFFGFTRISDGQKKGVKTLLAMETVAGNDPVSGSVKHEQHF